MMQGISTALSALYASQKAIDTTGNNIANVNTDGYTRQRVNLSEVGSTSVSFWAGTNTAGRGVEIESIQRLRDEFLEKQAITETSRSGSSDRVATTYNALEDVFSVQSGSTDQDNTLSGSIDNFFGAWDDVQDQSSATQVVEEANTMLSGFKAAYTSLTTLKENAKTTLKDDVNQINAIGKNIADINSSIFTLQATDGNINNLMDKRDQLLRSLSKLVDVNATVNEAGSMTVSIGGTALVRGRKASELEVDDEASPTVVRWQDGDNNPTTGNVAVISGGDAGGLMESINTIIPKFQASLDTAANAIATAVNNQHVAGYDSHGNPGTEFFTGTGVANMTINPALEADSSLLAVAATNVGGWNDNLNAQKVGALADSQTGPLQSYRSLISDLGTESQRANRRSATQTEVTKSANDNRQSVSGVSIDEEMTNLIQYQHSYTAAAKYLSTMNEVLDSLLGIIR